MPFVNSLLGGDVHCISQLRMDRRTFSVLCGLLHHDEHIKTDGLVTLEEQVCIFLHILKDEKIEIIHEISWKFRFFHIVEISFG